MGLRTATGGAPRVVRVGRAGLGPHPGPQANLITRPAPVPSTGSTTSPCPLSDRGEANVAHGDTFRVLMASRRSLFSGTIGALCDSRFPARTCPRGARDVEGGGDARSSRNACRSQPRPCTTCCCATQGVRCVQARLGRCAVDCRRPSAPRGLAGTPEPCVAARTPLFGLWRVRSASEPESISRARMRRPRVGCAGDSVSRRSKTITAMGACSRRSASACASSRCSRRGFVGSSPARPRARDGPGGEHSSSADPPPYLVRVPNGGKSSQKS